MEGKEYVQANHKQIYWTILQIKGKILKLLDKVTIKYHFVPFEIRYRAFLKH